MTGEYPHIGGRSGLKLTPEHYALVKRTALYLKTRLPSHFEVDDLQQSGIEGLLQAADSFDEKKGIPFDQFARTRIKGAMLDEVRRLSQSTRTTIKLKKEQDLAVDHLSKHLGRHPTSAETALYLGKDLDTFEKERLIAQSNETLSAEANPTLLPEQTDHRADPLFHIESAESLDLLAEAVTSLPERTQLILSLYYVEELRLKEIADIISVSESRISQLLSEAAKKLRSKLNRVDDKMT